MTQTDLTIKQAAELFGCSTQTVQAWIKAGRIKAYRLGETGSYRIPGAEVERVRAEWAYKPDTGCPSKERRLCPVCRPTPPGRAPPQLQGCGRSR